MIELPELPPIDPKMQIGYEAIRYVPGYSRQFVEEYARAFAEEAVRMAEYEIQQRLDAAHETGYRDGALNEREACAKLCESYEGTISECLGDIEGILAAKIRSRSEQS